jgi:hypothetical protein
MLRYIFISILSLFLLACSGMDVSQYKNQNPKLDLQAYLNGKIKGYGIVQDRHQNVTRRFDFSGVAHWNGSSGVFNEKIVYTDGKVEKRVWQFTKINDGYYEATTPDVIGKAIIKVAGNAMNWRYTMNVKVDDDTTYKIDFDDWMFLMSDGRLINRNYFHKYGADVGELTLFMEKVGK